MTKLDLAEAYYAVAEDMRAKANWWLAVARHLDEAADTMCEQNIAEQAAADKSCDVHTGGCDGRHEIHGPQSTPDKG